MDLYKKVRFERYDLFAVLACLILFGLFLVCMRFRACSWDESSYLALAQRFARGERPLIDEIHPGQLFCLFLAPFYSLFRVINGGTAGVVLFMRHIFLVFNFACYWILYWRLRAYRVWGIVITVLFCSYIPWSIYTLNYYTMPIRFLMLFCVVLFFEGEEPSKRRLILSGVLLSCAVIVQPPFALLYVLYCIAVLIFEIRRRKCPDTEKDYAFFFCWRSWFYMTISIVVCAGIFITVLGFWSGWKNIFASLPLVISNPDYSVFDFGLKAFFTEKIPELVRVCGVLNCSLAVIVLIVAVTITVFKKNTKIKYYLFFASNVLFLLMFSYYLMFKDYKFLYVVLDGFNNSVYPVALMCFGLVNYLLCREKDRNLFLIWLISVLASLSMDLFSAGSIGYCGILSVIPGIICFKKVLDEFTAEEKQSEKSEKQKRKKKNAKVNRQHRSKNMVAASVVVFLIFVVWKGFMIGFETYAQSRFNLREDGEANDVGSLIKIDKGPFQGIFTSQSNCEQYERTLRDMDLIRQETEDAVLLEDYNPYAMLYLDLPSVNCSIWNQYNMIDKQLQYFMLHPEKQPKVLGLMTHESVAGEGQSEESLQFARELADFLCEGTIEQSETGIIVKVNKWHTHTAEEMDAWLSRYGSAF